MNSIGGGGAVAGGDALAGDQHIVNFLRNHRPQGNLGGVSLPVGLTDSRPFNIARLFCWIFSHAGVKVDGILGNAYRVGVDARPGADGDIIGRNIFLEGIYRI